MSAFAMPISEYIWDMKYRLKTGDRQVLDETVEDSWRRVARALASVEDKSEDWETVFYDALSDFKFLPAGRILAGAGTGRSVTLFNCFVMGTIPDSISGIFDMLKEAAVTMQQGGGIGYDFSTIRPAGAKVNGVAADASGPLSFMDVWDAMCRTIMSAGARRGAMMATLRCDHPDVEAFIAAKRDAGRLRNFNLSVLVTDSFMAAIKSGGDWDLVFDGTVYRTVKARDLWDRIMRATYDYAEPGVIFINRINEKNNLHYTETISATNPCGEQPLPPYGACLLGSLNLPKFIRHPYEDTAHICLTSLRQTVRIAVRMMDNVIDVSRFPLPRQSAEARAKRRIGLGITGLADALMMAGVTYGSDEAVALTEDWTKAIAVEAYLTSADLSAEKGAFPLFDKDRYLAGKTLQAMPAEVRDAVAAKGIRNALLTSIAPTGTISLYAGNVSSGIEPVFAHSYHRKVTQRDGSKTEEEVTDYAVALWRGLKGDASLPNHFVTAQTIPPHAHVHMQAAAQKWIDSSISKTINCPEGIDFDDFKSVYMQAWDQGCKGCTTYRPNAVTGSVLSVSDEASVAVPIETGAASDPLDRPQVLEGITYKLKWPLSEHAMYITVNDVMLHGRRQPFEVFVNSKNMEHYSWTLALTRMISAVFRRGGDVSFVVEELKAVFDPRGGAWVGGTYVPSILAAIGGVIEEHLAAIGLIGKGSIGLADGTDANVVKLQMEGRTCEACGAREMRMVEGCMTCMSCGYDKCG